MINTMLIFFKESELEYAYRKSSNKRPGAYLNFQALRGALIRAGRLFFFSEIRISTNSESA